MATFIKKIKFTKKGIHATVLILLVVAFVIACIGIYGMAKNEMLLEKHIQNLSDLTDNLNQQRLYMNQVAYAAQVINSCSKKDDACRSTASAQWATAMYKRDDLESKISPLLKNVAESDQGVRWFWKDMPMVVKYDTL